MGKIDDHNDGYGADRRLIFDGQQTVQGKYSCSDEEGPDMYLVNESKFAR